MNRMALAVLAALALAATARADLEIKDVQAAHGPLGPERKSLDVYPFDELLFRYVVQGFKSDDFGRVDAKMQLRLADGTGKIIFDKEEPLKAVLSLGGDSFMGLSRLDFGPQVAAGEYTFSLTVTDNSDGAKATFKRKITVKEPEFMILAPRFFSDVEGKIPAPAGGIIGQGLHFRFRVVGVDRSKGKIDTDMTLEILDDKGKEVNAKPITGNVKVDDEEKVKMANILNFTGNLLLNRAGTFTLKVTVKDKISNKTTTYETPMKVTAP